MYQIVSKVQSENQNCNHSAQRIDVFLKLLKQGKRERITILF